MKQVDKRVIKLLIAALDSHMKAVCGQKLFALFRSEHQKGASQFVTLLLVLLPAWDAGGEGGISLGTKAHRGLIPAGFLLSCEAPPSWLLGFGTSHPEPPWHSTAMHCGWFC